MKCPKCRSIDLRPVKTAAPVFHLDTCPECKGVWFDAGELAGTLGQSAAQPAVPDFAFQGKDTLCPHCQVNLYEYCYPKTTVLVDGCKQCHGIWLDHREWPQIKAALSPPTPAADITCPKCHTPQAASDTCRHCGVIFRKYQQELMEQQAQAQAVEAQLQPIFSDARGFQIQQDLEWLEILSPFEIRNRYEVVVRATRNRSGTVEEQSQSFFNLIGRQILGSLRPAELSFRDESENLILTMKKRFRFYFHRLEVSSPDGKAIGTIERRFHLLRNNYEVLDRKGRPLIQITGPWLFLPFTDRIFRFTKKGKDIGELRKTWRGILREAFSDNDRFNSNIDPSLPETEKILLFGAIFLIDFGCFENNNGGSASLVNIGD